MTVPVELGAAAAATFTRPCPANMLFMNACRPYIVRRIIQLHRKNIKHGIHARSWVQNSHPRVVIVDGGEQGKT